MDVLCCQSGCSECGKEERNTSMQNMTPALFNYPEHANAVSSVAEQEKGFLMGLMDRDYMKGTGHKRAFSPSPKTTFIGWLGKLLILVSVIYLGFKLAHWLDYRAKPTPNTPAVTATPMVETDKQQPGPRPGPAQIPSYSPQQSAPSQPGIVTKCVTEGKTSYGDGNCAPGATASQLVTKANQNLMDAVTVPPTAQATAPASPSVAQTNPGPDYAAIKAECTWLEARIKYLDDLARQPQGA